MTRALDLFVHLTNCSLVSAGAFGSVTWLFGIRNIGVAHGLVSCHSLTKHPQAWLNSEYDTRVSRLRREVLAWKLSGHNQMLTGAEAISGFDWTG